MIWPFDALAAANSGRCAGEDLPEGDGILLEVLD
jgi:hypothetical protein